MSTSRRLALATALTLGIGVLSTLPPVASAAAASASTVDPADPDTAEAAAALRTDASSQLVVVEGSTDLRFAAARNGQAIDNPHVQRRNRVQDAAREHLERYGAALGTEGTGTELRPSRSTRTVSGQDTVRFDQTIDGVPVLGGQITLSLSPARELVSAASTLSGGGDLPTAEVSEGTARTAALTVSARSTGTAPDALTVTALGRAVFDPSVFDPSVASNPRAGWQFELSGDPGVRRLVVVDDQDGRILLDIDQVRHLDRVVCDNANVTHNDIVPCSAPARVETDPATGNVEVDNAFDLTGETARFYAEVGGLDLTGLIGAPGLGVGGGKSLASTVNWCFTAAEGCPRYANAFWDGNQMYLGEGFSGADDVTGHELTHGVIEQYSDLFYWGGSGAINESLADIMGEIIDHRRGNDDDTAWTVGEDLPGAGDSPDGTVRSLADPTLHGQPDSLSSSLYATGLADNAGVHTNSGISNKTAYLISQGGTAEGQAFPGIDAGDPKLDKSAVLYLDVLQRLLPGSGYHDLSTQLEQSCRDLAATGKAGFQTSDCTTVHLATVATGIAAPPPPTAGEGAALGCPEDPVHTRPRVLFDSETGDSAAKFTPDTGWVRGESPYWGANSTSGKDSWSFTRPWSTGATGSGSRILRAAQSIALPADQKSYIRFRSWYVFDAGYIETSTGTSFRYFDGGQLGYTDTTTGESWRPGSNGFVNGHNGVLYGGTGNPAGGQGAFVGNSEGWRTTRYDISSRAGHSVQPFFRMAYDSEFWFIGWFLDDITVYTCEPPPQNTTVPQISGTAKVGTQLTTDTGAWTPSAEKFTYQWLRAGVAISGATQRTYTPTGTDYGKPLSVRVTATSSVWAGGPNGVATSVPTAPVALGPALPSTTAPTVTGTLHVGYRLTVGAGTWRERPTALSYQWLRDGAPISGASGSAYTLVAADRGHRIAAKVTARATGWSAGTRTSSSTSGIGYGFLTSVTPTISGTRRVGSTLTANRGTWKPGTISYTYQWLRNGRVISGATGKTYRLRSIDRGDRIRVRVTGRKTGYYPLIANSAATSAIR